MKYPGTLKSRMIFFKLGKIKCDNSKLAPGLFFITEYTFYKMPNKTCYTKNVYMSKLKKHLLILTNMDLTGKGSFTLGTLYI